MRECTFEWMLPTKGMSHQEKSQHWSISEFTDRFPSWFHCCLLHSLELLKRAAIFSVQRCNAHPSTPNTGLLHISLLLLTTYVGSRVTGSMQNSPTLQSAVSAPYNVICIHWADGDVDTPMVLILTGPQQAPSLSSQGHPCLLCLNWLVNFCSMSGMNWGTAGSLLGFPGSSAGKESACNAGDLGLSPGSGRFPGEGIGYPLQYYWASLVAQTVKNPPAMQETLVQPLGWEDPLEEDMASHSNILAWRIPMDRGAWWATVCGVAKSQTRWSTKHSTGSLLGADKLCKSPTMVWVPPQDMPISSPPHCLSP